MIRTRAIRCLAWVLAAGMSATAANAQDLSGAMEPSGVGGRSAGFVAGGPLAAAAVKREWRFEPVHESVRPRASAPHVLHRSPRRASGAGGATRLTAGLALGVLGFLGDGLAGAVIAGKGDSAMGGFAIGSGVGAGAGFAAGMLLTR